jgi:hypothetical protein
MMTLPARKVVYHETSTAMKILLFSLNFIVLHSMFVVAQPHNPPPPEPVPIAGIEFLIFSGCAYGLYMLIKRRKP